MGFPRKVSSLPFPLSPGLCLIQLYVSLRDGGALALSLRSRFQRILLERFPDV